MALSNLSRALIALVGVIVFALAVDLVLQATRSSSPAPDATAQSPDSQLPPTETGGPEWHEPTPSERARFPQVPVVVNASTRATAPALTIPRTEPTPYSRQLVAGLTNLDFSHGPLTKEQADQWKKGLRELTGQGATAVPAIREFLELNRDLTFGAASTDLGELSTRTALINALALIGGPEANSVMLQTLQTSAGPSELALLAQQLEQIAPGQYRQQVISAVNEVLAMAGKGQIPGTDVGAAFKVLQSYGDAATAEKLEQLQGQWRYYAAMSLAGLPESQGVPVLVKEAQNSAAGAKRDLALQMLAQLAPQNADAATALLEQARGNEISEASWRKIATGLAGDQYQIGTPPVVAGQLPISIPGLKTYHIESGNQNFYSLPVPADGQVQQRIALIDQLLGLNPSPDAAAALSSARETLAALVPQ